MKKGQRPRKKVVVILVEGPSELRALSNVLSALYDSIDPDYEVFFPNIIEDGDEHWGDLTSKYGIVPEKIEMCIEKLYFHDFLQINKLYPKDITEIIHILDMDGAYIDDSCIQHKDNPLGLDKTYYAEDKILTDNVPGIVERNARKRANIDYLCSLNKIKIGSKSIPYSAYFFSSNLDHFLYDEANVISGKEKVRLAEDFSMQYACDPDEFITVIKETPGVLMNMTYDESWAFIRERGNHSLERHSNINQLFSRI